MHTIAELQYCLSLCYCLPGAGAKAVADVDPSRHKYAMTIIMPSSDETDEFRLTFESVSTTLLHLL